MANPRNLPRLAEVVGPTVEFLGVVRVGDSWRVVEATVPLSQCRQLTGSYSTEMRAVAVAENEGESRRIRRMSKRRVG